MKKIFILFAMLMVFGLTAMKADVTETVYDTVNIVVPNAIMQANDSTSTFYTGNDTTTAYEVGVTFMNDTLTDSLTIAHNIASAYIYSNNDSVILCNILDEDSISAVLTLDTAAMSLNIVFAVNVEDTIGEFSDTLLITTYNVDMTYIIYNPTSVENVTAVFPYNVYTNHSTIIINGAENELTYIYDVNGRLVYNKRLTSDNAYITVNSGIYFININGATTKVIVK